MLLWVGIIAVSTVRCQDNVETRSTTDKEEQAQIVDVHAIWKKHERVMEGALAGRPHVIEKFGAACSFFTRLSGIEIRGNGSFFGWLPNQDTAVDFEKVKIWYAENKDRLYWDEQSKSVQVRSGSPES